MTQKPRPSPERDWDTVIPDDLRPAGNGKDCFYCQVPLGRKHQQDCVIRLGAGWFNVAIRKNDTGEIRVYRNDMAWQPDHSHWHWTEGNYGCDCNRHLFWQYADGVEPENADWDHECGTLSFSVLYAELPNGERIPIDDVADSASPQRSEP